MSDHSKLKRDAQDQIDGNEVTCDPVAVLALIAENERLSAGMKGDYDLDAWLKWTAGRDQLKADNEALHAQLERYAADPSGSKVVACRAAAAGNLLPEHIFSDDAKSPALDSVFALYAENKRQAELLECAQGDLKQAMQIIEKNGKDAERLDWLTAQGEIEQPGQGDVRGFIDAAMSKEG